MYGVFTYVKRRFYIYMYGLFTYVRAPAAHVLHEQVFICTTGITETLGCTDLRFFGGGAIVARKNG